MELKNFFAQDLQGNVIPSPTAYIYQPGTTTLATGLQNAAGAALTNPFTGTANGQVTVAAPDGEYDMRVTGAGRDTTMRVRFISVSEDAVAAAEAAAQTATAQAQTATTQAGLATTNGAAQVALAAQQATLAASAKTAAEAARDAAQLSAGVYPSTTEGLAATTTGQYFSVPSAESAEYLILYLNSAGVAVEQKRYPSVAAIADLQLADQFGTARNRYLESLRTAGTNKPLAAVVVLLGQSLNAPRGSIVQAKAAPIGKMPVGGASIANWNFYSLNAEITGHWDELATATDYVEEAGQTPGTGIINALAGGKFARVYLGNVAVPARRIEVLMAGGCVTNLNATLHRLCALARADGFDPRVMFYTAHGEANAANSTTEQAYYSLGMEYYGRAQLYAAQAMRKPGYVAPIVFTHPIQQNGSSSTNPENDRNIKRAITRLAADLPGGMDLGPAYQWPADTDRTHPTEPGYVQRGEAVGKALREYFERSALPASLYITDVTLSGSTFVATFSGPVVRDDTLGVGQNVSTALAEDGLEWIDNGTQIAIVAGSLVYSGWRITGTLASAPVGTLAQQVLRVAEQSIPAALMAGATNLAGSVIRMAGSGWPSIYQGFYINHVWAAPTAFKSVRAA